MSIGKPVISGLLKLKSSRVVHSCVALACGRLGAMSFKESNKVRKRAFSTEVVSSKPLISTTTTATAEARNQIVQEEESETICDSLKITDVNLRQLIFRAKSKIRNCVEKNMN